MPLVPIVPLSRIPFSHSDESPSSCPSQCMDRRGDGVCDTACDTGACLFDYGDCDNSPSCSSHSCPSDQCSWKCALSGCQKGTCQLSEEGQMEYFWAHLPSINPQLFFNKFLWNELCMRQQLGYSIRLVSDAAGPMIFGRRRADKKLTRMTLPSWQLYNLTSEGEIEDSSLVLFSIHSHSIVHMRDAHVIDRLRRIGLPKIHAKITLFTLSKKERSTFQDEFGLFIQRYNQGNRGYKENSEKLCMEENQGRAARYLHEEEIDEEMDVSY